MQGVKTSKDTERKAIRLYVQGLSERKVEEELGISHETVRRILVRNNKARRSVGRHEIYPKTDFSGDPLEQARIIGFIEDCAAGYNHKQVHVQTTTTHLAQIKLFNSIFGRYGHVGMTAGYNKRYSYHYEWHMQVLLKKPSFKFLIEYKDSPTNFLAIITENGYDYNRIGGLADAESWVGIDTNKGHPRAVLSIYNKNRRLLEWTQRTIGGNISRGNDCYQLQLYREEAVDALRRLPLMHEEKAVAKELILHYANNGGIGMEALRAYRKLRRKIDEEVRLCTLQARLAWIRQHRKPHPNDPDQTIPKNLTLSPPLFPLVRT